MAVVGTVQFMQIPVFVVINTAIVLPMTSAARTAIVQAQVHAPPNIARCRRGQNSATTNIVSILRHGLRVTINSMAAPSDTKRQKAQQNMPKD